LCAHGDSSQQGSQFMRSMYDNKSRSTFQVEVSPERNRVSQLRSSNSEAGGFGVGHITSLAHKRWKVRSRKITIAPSDTSALSRLHSFRLAAAAIVRTDNFDVCTGFLVFLNTILIGVDQTLRLQGNSTSIFEWIEQLFLLCYIIEQLLYFLARGARILRNPWHQLDLCLIGLSILTQWILMPLIGQSQQELSRMVLRIARMARLARTAKLLVKIRDLWILLQGLLYSARLVFHSVVLLCIMLYVLAVLGIEVIRLDTSYSTADEEYRLHVDEWFPTIPMTMLSILQFICMDSIGSIYRPFIAYRGILVLYFAAVIILASIVFMNIVNAVMVNSALEQASRDKEMVRQKAEAKKVEVMENLQTVFRTLDKDNSGQLDRDEVLSATDKEIAAMGDLGMFQTPVAIFDQLDVKASGMLDIDEFCDGLYDCAMSGAPIELKRIERITTMIAEQQQQILNSLDQIGDKMQDMTCLLRMKFFPSPVEEKKLSSSFGPSTPPISGIPSLHMRESVSTDVPLWAKELLSHLLDIKASIQVTSKSTEFDQTCFGCPSEPAPDTHPFASRTECIDFPQLNRTRAQVTSSVDQGNNEQIGGRIDEEINQVDDCSESNLKVASFQPLLGLGYTNASTQPFHPQSKAAGPISLSCPTLGGSIKFKHASCH